MCLNDFNKLFNSNGWSCKSFGLPEPIECISNLEVVDTAHEKRIGDELYSQLNPGQKAIVDEILFACSNDSRDCNTYFIDGPGNLNLKFVLNPY